MEDNQRCIDIFCDFDGNPIFIIPRERVQFRAWEVLKTPIYMDRTMIEEAKKLCEAFRPCGPMTVQLIEDKKLEKTTTLKFILATVVEHLSA